ncbi:MAG: Hsp20/alpha crystallin family protein, partial [Bacteroidota bacterium]|nr:Hsp20/alpha crystallin family protein [Bacteroidota bacterium]
KAETTVEESKKLVTREFSLQPFKRSFTMDEKVVSDNIAAKYENGLLVLTIPKKEEVKVAPKQIEVS